MLLVESIELFVETTRGIVRRRFKRSVVCSNSGSLGFASVFNSSNERNSNSLAAEAPVKATKQTISRNPFRIYIFSAVLVPLVCCKEALCGIRNAGVRKISHANPAFRYWLPGPHMSTGIRIASNPRQYYLSFLYWRIDVSDVIDRSFPNNS